MKILKQRYFLYLTYGLIATDIYELDITLNILNPDEQYVDFYKLYVKRHSRCVGNNIACYSKKRNIDIFVQIAIEHKNEINLR